MPKLQATAAKATKKNVTDGDGLRIKIAKAKCGKSYLFRYRSPITGKTRDMGLGAVALTALADARIMADEARRLVRQGIDPIDAGKAAKQAKVTANERTFDAAVELCIAGQKPGWSYIKMEAEWRQSLNDYAMPFLRGVPVDQIDRTLILRLLQQPMDGKTFWEAKTETASRVRNRIERILDCVKALSWWKGENPAAWRGGLIAVLAAPKKVTPVRHHAALDWRQAPSVLAMLRQSDDRDAAMTEFLAHVGTRVKPVWLMTWSEVDFELGVWTVPAAHEKSKREHRVPLSDRARQLLHAQHTPNCQPDQFVWPSEDGGKRGHACINLCMARLGIPGTPHGFRSTIRDWCGEATSYSADVAEAVLSHQLGSKTRTSYQRGSLFSQRQCLMADWSDYLAGAEIIDLERRAA